MSNAPDYSTATATATTSAVVVAVLHAGAAVHVTPVGVSAPGVACKGKGQNEGGRHFG